MDNSLIIIPIIFSVILLFAYRKYQKNQINAESRTVWCSLKNKRVDSFKLEISSPKFKIYLLTFTDVFGNDIEVEIRDVKKYKELKEGEEGFLTYSKDIFISYKKEKIEAY
ncbi:DUF2500 family protein [Brevibacillus sp. SYSU BS000544]|uniref:DUF2500 family protein n=1 Tax=Brevibacillus sp. SYSU BS000544 TaxID=3416443 RepID=UPI003CE4E78F